MMDPRVHIFDHLIAGVPTGFQNDIPLSNCFPTLTDPVDNSHIHLSVHPTNWKSAEDNIDIARDLVQAEVDAGWVEQFHGTIGDAQSKWPLGVSVGKLGIALSEHRPPRLVVDSSVCGLNSRWYPSIYQRCSTVFSTASEYQNILVPFIRCEISA